MLWQPDTHTMSRMFLKHLSREIDITVTEYNILICFYQARYVEPARNEWTTLHSLLKLMPLLSSHVINEIINREPIIIDK